MIEKKYVKDIITKAALTATLKDLEDKDSFVSMCGEILDAVDKLPEERSVLCDLYIRDRDGGRVHRIGEDKHDGLWVDSEGTLHYHNLQNGDGCIAYRSQDEVFSFGCGYEFVSSDMGITIDNAPMYNFVPSNADVYKDGSKQLLNEVIEKVHEDKEEIAEPISTDEMAERLREIKPVGTICLD